MLGKGHGLSTTVILGPHGSEQHRDALAPERTLHYEAAAKAEGAGLKVVQNRGARTAHRTSSARA